MCFKILLIFTLTIVSILAEAPLGKSSGPYPDSGWRPRKPFNLPGEYLPPVEIQKQQQPQQQQQPDKVDVEINKERIDFAGQIQGNNLATNQPQSAYLPPNRQDTDFFKVQRLPNQNQPQFVRQEPEQNAQSFNQQQRPQQQQFGQRLQPKEQQFGQRLQPNEQQPQNFQPQQPQSQFFPENEPQQPFAKPSQEYGAPIRDGQINIVYPDPRSLQQDDQAEAVVQDNRIALEALNETVNNYNRAQAQQQNEADESEDYNDDQFNANAGYPYKSAAASRLTQGQYYVLGPDNTLQRVMFTTSQDEQETRSNGFTAQLKYTPVGEVRDPVFKYNNRGQLVRILKK